MIDFNCTVKDLFRRRSMIDKAVRSLADNGFPEHAATYAVVRNNMYNALAYAASNMKDYEYRVASAYFESRDSEMKVSQKMYYTHRTIRRYIRKACEYISEYYAKELGIGLLPFFPGTVECSVSGVTFWEKTNSLIRSISLRSRRRIPSVVSTSLRRLMRTRWTRSPRTAWCVSCST